MIKKLKLLISSGLAKNIMAVASGTAGAQLITILLSPILTRMYGPEAFGELGVFSAILAVLGPVAALTYPSAIVLPQRDEEAFALVKLSFTVSLCFFLITGIALVVAGGGASSTLQIDRIPDFIYFIPVALLSSAWLQLAQQWVIRKKAFKSIGRSMIINSIFVNFAKVLGGGVIPSGIYLIVLTVIGSIFQTVLLLFDILKSGVHKPKYNDVSSRMVDLAHAYRDFPIYRAPQNLINALSQSVPAVMLAMYFGPVAAGFFALANSVMGIPSSIVGKAVVDVLYPRITEAVREKENAESMIFKTTLFLAGVGLIPFGAVVIFGPWLFELIFGAGWSEGGEYARWLAFFYFMNFVNKPAVAAVPILRIQRGLLVYEIGSTLSKVLVFWFIANFYKNDLWAIATFSIVGALAYIGMIIWIIGVARGVRNETS